MATALSTLLDALYLALWLSLPALVTGFALAAGVGFLQSAAKLNEPALNAIPRALGVALSLVASGAWMAAELTQFTEKLLRALPELVR